MTALHGPFEIDLNAPEILIPVWSTRVPAGFISPAEGYEEDTLNLNQLFGVGAASVFAFRVEGDSMQGDNPEYYIPDGSTVIVDRRRAARHGDVVVAHLDGDFTIKRLSCRAGRVALVPENKSHKRIELRDGQAVDIWGVVIGWMRKI